MPWGRAIAVWLLIVVVESLNGTLRELFLAPMIGDFTARRIGFFIAVGLILGIAWLTAPWLGPRARASKLTVGALWLVLMLAFEFGLGFALGLSRERILADYDLSRGGLMGFGLVVMLFAPSFGFWARQLTDARPPPGQAHQDERMR